MNNKKVIIVGGGFGGLTAAKQFKNKNFDVTLIDKTNHHLFQPLLYQVATAALSPGDIAIPIRAVFSGINNIHILMDEVISINKEEAYVQLKSRKINFDYLILAPGSSHSYFGHDEWEKFAPGLKTLNDALSIREKILCSFEEAEKISEKTKRDPYLTFIIIGGGPTGVEMAGAIAEISKKTMMKDFRNIRPEDTKVYLVEAAPRILTAYSEHLSNVALKDLEEMGVKVLTNSKVLDISGTNVVTKERTINSQNIIWAAGNKITPLIHSLDCELDHAGRVIVENDLSLKNHQNIFVIGDAANVKDKNGNLLPGIAPVAIQQGKYVARLIINEFTSRLRKPFKYFDKGMMATIGKAKAIAKIRKLEFAQLIAWLLWSFIHIFFLITFRNRFRVMAEWVWYYFTSRRGVRLITKRQNKNK